MGHCGQSQPCRQLRLRGTCDGAPARDARDRADVERYRITGPRRSCAVVPRAALDTALGPLSQTPPLATAHGCQWQGSSTLEVSTQWTDLSTMRGDAAIDLGDGHPALPRSSTLTSGCELLYAYRTVAGRQEIVEVGIEGAKGQREVHCATARSILVALIPALPKANCRSGCGPGHPRTRTTGTPTRPGVAGARPVRLGRDRRRRRTIRLDGAKRRATSRHGRRGSSARGAHGPTPPPIDR